MGLLDKLEQRQFEKQQKRAQPIARWFNELPWTTPDEDLVQGLISRALQHPKPRMTLLQVMDMVEKSPRNQVPRENVG